MRQRDRPHRVVLVAADEDHQVPTCSPSIAAGRVEQAEDVAAEALAAARGLEVVDALGQVVDVRGELPRVEANQGGVGPVQRSRVERPANGAIEGAEGLLGLLGVVQAMPTENQCRARREAGAFRAAMR